MTANCMTTNHGDGLPHCRRSINKMALIALGIVFGDIGTSPLYAYKLTLDATGHSTPTSLDAIGIASMIIWALLLTVLVKYVWMVLRADNDGQGGILALVSLVKPASWSAGAGLGVLGFIGMMGAAFLMSDGVITPAISVLSAMEGMKVIAPSFETFVVPATVGILLGLFCIQRFGTHSIGRFFGPVMVVWLATIAGLGIFRIAEDPGVLVAFNPLYAFEMMRANINVAFAIFGAVFLVLTGGEALYADMGHVGAPAIRRAFIFIELPALVLNYLGQAALVIMDPSTADSPFYKLAPSVVMIPMILLASAATVIASQALISGVFSLNLQGMQMSILPRMKVVQTHQDEEGQIYIPAANWLLMVVTIGVVIAFRTSDALGSAYGIAVSGNMLITTILLTSLIFKQWRKPLLAVAVAVFFGTIDAGFLVSNSMKLIEGGWFPLTLAAGLTFIMVAWRSGTWAVRRELEGSAQTVAQFIEHIDDGKVARVPGTAVWLTKVTDGITRMLTHYIESTGALHERVIMLTVETAKRPFVLGKDRLEIRELGHGFTQLIYHVGYMQSPKIDGAIARVTSVHAAIHDVHYFVGHETLLRKEEGPRLCFASMMAFSLLKKVAAKRSDFFHLRFKRVMEIGLRVAI